MIAFKESHCKDSILPIISVSNQGGDSQNFLGKFIRFFEALKCFYEVVIRYFMI